MPRLQIWSPVRTYTRIKQWMHNKVEQQIESLSLSLKSINLFFKETFAEHTHTRASSTHTLKDWISRPLNGKFLAHSYKVQIMQLTLQQWWEPRISTRHEVHLIYKRRLPRKGEVKHLLKHILSGGMTDLSLRFIPLCTTISTLVPLPGWYIPMAGQTKGEMIKGFHASITF